MVLFILSEYNPKDVKFQIFLHLLQEPCRIYAFYYTQIEILQIRKYMQPELPFQQLPIYLFQFFFDSETGTGVVAVSESGKVFVVFAVDNLPVFVTHSPEHFVECNSKALVLMIRIVTIMKNINL